jgi:hypothetical protein
MERISKISIAIKNRVNWKNATGLSPDTGNSPKHNYDLFISRITFDGNPKKSQKNDLCYEECKRWG